MSYLKAAIATILLLLISLCGFVLYSFGDDYRIHLAFEAYTKGDYQQAKTILEDVSKTTSSTEIPFSLYYAYIARSEEQLLFSNALLEKNEAFAPKDKLELFLNKALNHFLLHDPLGMEEALKEATALSTAGEERWIAFFTSLKEGLLQRPASPLFSLEELLQWPALSPWMEKTVKSTFTKEWETTMKARLLIGKGNYGEARNLLEVGYEEANDRQKDERDLLLALSYLKEGGEKPPEKGIAYYKIALPYLSHIPLNHQRFRSVKAELFSFYQKAAFALIDKNRYEELPFFTYALDKIDDPTAMASFLKEVKQRREKKEA